MDSLSEKNLQDMYYSFYKEKTFYIQIVFSTFPSKHQNFVKPRSLANTCMHTSRIRSIRDFLNDHRLKLFNAIDDSIIVCRDSRAPDFDTHVSIYLHQCCIDYYFCSPRIRLDQIMIYQSFLISHHHIRYFQTTGRHI